jgi:hypothetical protein
VIDFIITAGTFVVFLLTVLAFLMALGYTLGMACFCRRHREVSVLEALMYYWGWDA